MALLKGIDGNSIEINPLFLKKIMFSELEEQKDKSNWDTYEKYQYFCDIKSGNFKWFNDEFDLDSKAVFENLSIYFEYTSIVLTIMRLNKFFNSKNKNMVSVLSTEMNNYTMEIISKNFFYYTLNESPEITFMYIKKKKNYYEHSFIFSLYDYHDYFEITLKCTKNDIIKFYRDLLNETNEFRTDMLPAMMKNMVEHYKDYVGEIEYLRYDDIKSISDDYFELFDVDLKNVFNDIESAEDLKDYVNYIHSVKSEEFSDSDDYDEMSLEENKIEIDFLIKDMKELEQSLKNSLEENNENKNYDEFSNESSLLYEIEEDFMSLLDQVIFNELVDFESKEELHGEIKSIIDTFKSAFDNDFKEKEDFEKKLIIDIINTYGIESVRNNIESLASFFEFVNLTHELEDLYLLSEDKKINDYKRWYKKLFEMKGKNIKNIQKN